MTEWLLNAVIFGPLLIMWLGLVGIALYSMWELAKEIRGND